MNKRIGSTVAICILLLFFVGASFGLVTLGAKIYKQIEKDARHNFESRTPMSYLTMKLRQNDRVGSVQIRSLEGQEALVLLEEVEGIVYETWIYSYDNELREAYIEAGDEMNLQSGMGIMPLHSLELHKEAKCVTFIMEDLEGNKTETTIALRSGGSDR